MSEDATKRVREDFLATFKDNIICVQDVEKSTGRVGAFCVWKPTSPTLPSDIPRDALWDQRGYRVTWECYCDEGFQGLRAMIGRRRFAVRSLPEVFEETYFDTMKPTERVIVLRLAFPPGEWEDKTSAPAGARE